MDDCSLQFNLRDPILGLTSSLRYWLNYFQGIRAIVAADNMNLVIFLFIHIERSGSV
jgi:hypothetical protein